MLTTDESTRWHQLCDAIEAVYAVFARYHMEGPIRCEMSDRIIVADNLPLRTRTATELVYYSGKAMTTLGSVQDYKHLLPRLLELSCQHQRRVTVECETITADEHFEPSISFLMVEMKLADAHPEGWPAVELEALQTFGHAKWRWELVLPERYTGGIEQTMEFLKVLRISELSLVSEVLNSNNQRNIERLCREMVRWLDDLLGRLPATGIGPGSNAARKTWLAEPLLAPLVEASFFRLANSPAAAALSDVSLRLGWLSAAL